MDTTLEGFLKVILCKLVSKPEEVSVQRTSDEQGVLFTVKVAPGDNGKIIGKAGQIAQAIRTILRSAGYLEDVRASMKVDAPNSRFVLPEEERG